MPQPSRREVLAGASALALARGAGLRSGAAPDPRQEPGQEQDTRRPNVLFVIADQHRFDAAGFAGNGTAATPHLDRLAREGTVLERLYCHNPLCIPARQSLITGLPSWAHGWFGNVGNFPDDLPTLVRHWRDQGYQTAMLGKAHMATHDFERVVEKAAMYRAWCADHPQGGQAGDRATAEVDAALARVPERLRELNPLLRAPGEDEFQMEPVVVAEARRFLAERDAHLPFFLWASFVQPHPPLFPPAAWLDRFRAALPEIQGPLSAAEEAALPRFVLDMRRFAGVEQLDLEQLRNVARAYFAATAWMDHCVGELLALLESQGLAGDTLVVYTSDHGEMLGDHGVLGKFTLYEGACRVPAIVRVPDGWNGPPAGGRVARVSQHLDLVASLFRLAGLPQPDGLAGAPLPELCPDLEGGGPPEEALCELYYRAESHVTVPREALAAAIVTPRWKYAWQGPEEESLFDLEADPTERRDLGRAPEHAARVAELRERWRARVPSEVFVMRRQRGR